MQTDKKNYSGTDVIKVSLTVNNLGNRDGMETVQLYVSELGQGVNKAKQELKAFKKVQVASGKVTDVTLELRASDLSWFDDNQMKWVLTPGIYRLSAGSSSRDIRMTADIKIN
jgi:beta-glucosidase